jgi:hypothetical protein
MKSQSDFALLLHQAQTMRPLSELQLHLKLHWQEWLQLFWLPSLLLEMLQPW